MRSGSLRESLLSLVMIGVLLLGFFCMGLIYGGSYGTRSTVNQNDRPIIVVLHIIKDRAKRSAHDVNRKM